MVIQGKAARIIGNEGFHWDEPELLKKLSEELISRNMDSEINPLQIALNCSVCVYSWLILPGPFMMDNQKS